MIAKPLASGLSGGLVTSDLWYDPAVNPDVPDVAALLVRFKDNTSGLYPHRLYSTPVGSEPQPISLAVGVTEHNLIGLPQWNASHTVTLKVWTDPSEVSPTITNSVFTSPENPPGISASAVGQNSVTLALTNSSPPPASTNPGTGYHVEQSATGSDPWVSVGGIIPVASVATPIVVSGLSGSTTYHWRASGVNGNPVPHDSGRSKYSTVIATTTADTTPPVISEVAASPASASANLSAKSNEAGKIYWYVRTGATPPSKADLKNGVGAVYHLPGGQVTSAGAVATHTATGLTDGVTHYLDALSNDGNNDSAIVSTLGFIPGASDYRVGLIHELVGENVNGGTYSDGANVTIWEDTGSLGYDATDPGGVFLPNIKVGAINGRDALRFTGSNGQNLRFVTPVPTGVNFTMFFVVNIDAQTGAYGAIWFGDLGAIYATSAKKMNLYEGGDHLSSVISGWNIISLTVSATGAWSWRINGVNDISAASGIAAPGWSAGYVGLDPYTSNFGGDIAQIRLYNSVLSAANISAVENFLSIEYGITITR